MVWCLHTFFSSAFKWKQLFPSSCHFVFILILDEVHTLRSYAFISSIFGSILSYISLNFLFRSACYIVRPGVSSRYTVQGVSNPCPISCYYLYELIRQGLRDSLFTYEASKVVHIHRVLVIV